MVGLTLTLTHPYCLCRLNLFAFEEKHMFNHANTHTPSRQCSVPDQGHLTGLSWARVVKIALSLNKVMVTPCQIREESSPICATQQLQLLLLLRCPTTHHLLLQWLKDLRFRQRKGGEEFSKISKCCEFKKKKAKSINLKYRVHFRNVHTVIFNYNAVNLSKYVHDHNLLLYWYTFHYIIVHVYLLEIQHLSSKLSKDMQSCCQRKVDVL